MDAFRQNCTTFVQVLKPRIKAAKQQTGLDIATFFCDNCMLGRRTYRNQTHLLEQIVANSFIEGLKYNTFWRELKKLKHATADNAFTKVLDFQTYLELQGPNAAGNANGSSTDVNQLTKQFLQDNSVIFEEVVRSLKRDIDKLLQNRDRRLRRKSCGQEPYTNDSMERRKRIDLHRRIESSYGNGKRDDGKDNVSSRNCRENCDNSRNRYGQSYDSIERNPGHQKNQFDSSHFVLTIGETIVRTEISRVVIVKSDHNDHTATSKVTTIAILIERAILEPPGHTINQACVARELTTIHETVGLF